MPKHYIVHSKMEDFFKNPKFFFTITGCWPKSKSTWTWLYHLYSFVLVYVVSYVFMISLTIDIYLSLGDLGVVADASYYFLTHLTYVIKLTIFTFRRPKFIKILEDLENPIFSTYLPEQKIFVKKWSSFTATYSKYFYITCYICWVFYGVFPMIDHDENNILPFRGWFPFDVKISLRNRGFVYAFHMLGLAVAIAVNASLDLFATIVMNIACSQMEIMMDDLQYSTRRAENRIEGEVEVRDIEDEREDELKEDAKLEKILGDNYVVMLSKEADDIVHDILTRSIEHHKAIIKLLSDLETLFSAGMFVQFLTTGIAMCITGIQLIVVPPTSMKFYTVISYFASVTFEIFVYCWNGHEVIERSSNIGESCYNMEWYRCSIRVRKCIFIIMERTKQPINMTAGKFFILSINTLAALLRTSYSYFAVLRRVYQPDDLTILYET